MRAVPDLLDGGLGHGAAEWLASDRGSRVNFARKVCDFMFYGKI